MNLTIEVFKCSDCPNLDYTPEGSVCRMLPLEKGFVLARGGKTKIVFDCPLNKGK